MDSVLLLGREMVKYIRIPDWSWWLIQPWFFTCEDYYSGNSGARCAHITPISEITLGTVYYSENSCAHYAHIICTSAIMLVFGTYKYDCYTANTKINRYRIDLP